MSPASYSSSSGSRWGKTKTRTFLKSNVQSLFRTVKDTEKNQSVWSQWSFKQIKNATFSPFSPPWGIWPIYYFSKYFYQSFHQRPSRNDHLVGHCHILFAKEISGRFLTFLILDSITSYKFLENMNATICIIYNQESHQKFDWLCATPMEAYWASSFSSKSPSSVQFSIMDSVCLSPLDRSPSSSSSSGAGRPVFMLLTSQGKSTTGQREGIVVSFSAASTWVTPSTIWLSRTAPANLSTLMKMRRIRQVICVYK